MVQGYLHDFYLGYLLTCMSGDFSPDIINYRCSIVDEVPLVYILGP